MAIDPPHIIGRDAARALGPHPQSVPDSNISSEIARMGAWLCAGLLGPDDYAPALAGAIITILPATAD
jgi:hypothetical protein